MEDTEISPNPSAMASEAVDTHETAEPQASSQKKSPQESFSELKKAKEDAERKAWQAQKELELERQLRQQPQQQPAAPPAAEPDFDFRQLENEDFPDGKKLVQAFGQINRKLTGYEAKLLEKEVKIQGLEFAIEHPDFRDIVTAENIEKYIKNDEDNREAVEMSKNPLRKVYNLIKKSAAYQADKAAKATTNKPISQEQRRVDEKDTKPKTGSHGVRSDAVSTAAYVSNSKMTKDQRNALWKETLAASRR